MRGWRIVVLPVVVLLSTMGTAVSCPAEGGHIPDEPAQKGKQAVWLGVDGLEGEPVMNVTVVVDGKASKSTRRFSWSTRVEANWGARITVTNTGTGRIKCWARTSFLGHASEQEAGPNETCAAEWVTTSA